MSDYFTEAHGGEPDEKPSIDTGGQAFPNPTSADFQHPACGGMTLRDWFAGQVDLSTYSIRATLERKLDGEVTIGEIAAYIAQIRYIEADAMIARRGKP